MFILYGTIKGEMGWSGVWINDTHVAVACFEDFHDGLKYIKENTLSRPNYKRHQVFRQGSRLERFDSAHVGNCDLPVFTSRDKD